MKRCPCKGCVRRIPSSFLVCRQHYATMPFALRREYDDVMAAARRGAITRHQLRYAKAKLVAKFQADDGLPF